MQVSSKALSKPQMRQTVSMSAVSTVAATPEKIQPNSKGRVQEASKKMQQFGTMQGVPQYSLQQNVN